MFDLDEEHRIKFELLKEHFKGVYGFLQALRGKGYVPDRQGDLKAAIDELYAEIEQERNHAGLQ